MRAILRRLVLATLGAVVAMGLGGSAASATSPIEVIGEPGGQHCSTMGGGYCNLHFVGEQSIYFHFFGIESQVGDGECRFEVELELDEDGNGLVTDPSSSTAAHMPTATNCSELPPCSLPWPASTEDDGPSLTVHVDVCYEPPEFGSFTCSGEYVFTASEVGGPTEGETQYLGSMDQRIGSSFCELHRDLEIESDESHTRIHFRP